MKYAVILGGLTLALLPLQTSSAHVRPTWHCHQFSGDYVRCHRALYGKLVPVASGDIRCAPIRVKVSYDEDGRPFVAKRGPKCAILRVYLQEGGG